MFYYETYSEAEGRLTESNYSNVNTSGYTAFNKLKALTKHATHNSLSLEQSYPITDFVKM